MNVGELITTIGADTRGLTQGLNDAKSQMASFTKDSSSGFQAVDKSAGSLNSTLKTLAISFGVYKVAAATKDLIVDSALLASRYTTLGIVMNTVGSNAGYTNKQMAGFDKSLQATGISMIESRHNLAAMMQSQLDLNNATKLGRVAQDAAVIGNMNSSESFANLIHGIQSGNVLILRNMGIMVDFEASYKSLAVQLKKNKEDLTQQERVQARVNEVMRAGVLIEGTYEAAMSTSGKQLQSMVRYVENFKVELGAAFEPAMTTLVFAATEQLKKLSKTINDPNFQEGLITIAEGFASLTTTIMKAGVETAAFWVKLMAAPTASEIQMKQIDELESRIASYKDNIASWQVMQNIAGFGFDSFIKENLAKVAFLEKAVANIKKSMKMPDITPVNYTSSDSDWAGINEEMTISFNESLKKMAADEAAAQLLREEARKVAAAKAKAAAKKLAADLLKGTKEFELSKLKIEESASAKLNDLLYDNANNGKVLSDMEIAHRTEEMKKLTDSAKYKKTVLQSEHDQALALISDLTDAEEDFADKKLDVYKDLYNSLDDYSEDAYQSNVEVIRAQKNNYMDFARQVRMNAQETARYEILVDQKITEDLRRETQKRTLLSNDFFRGIKVGYDRSLQDQMTWAKGGLALFETFSKSGSSTLSNVLFDGIKGDMQGFQSYWDSFFNSLLRTLTDTVAKMAIQWGIEAAFSGGQALGWWDSGLWEAAKDQVAVIHKGEMVVPADIANVLRGGEGSGSVSDLGQVSPSGGHEWGDDTKATFGAMAQGSARSYSLNAAQGISLFGQGAISLDRLAAGLINPSMLIGSVLAGGIPAGVGKGLGIDPTAQSWGGTMGGMGLSMALGSLAGVPGAAVAALGAVLGMLAFEGIMDAFNVRANEALKDTLEDQFGAWGGHTAYASLSNSLGDFGMAAFADRGFSGTPGIGQGDWGGVTTTPGYGRGGAGDDPSAPGGDFSGYGGPAEGEESSSGFWRHGGWIQGPESGYRTKGIFHGKELILNEAQVDAVRELNAGGKGVEINFNIDGNLIADEKTMDDFVRKIEVKLNAISRNRF